ncbi:DUF6538 domain-containing protein [Stenotrophomonas sp. 24(2023)]|uniref:DUF6538 domain-containing protein n=1 Tax=Stenotrophomonas sp. 24(2023) TaxID=3068324 RepID=UPI0027DF87A6|nr:DUF6538 domain-containing protein [Stenotrophomonas sp. 24(2023)]WMJ68703.1 hypothetical protein Q9R17_16155 [Stenotrophomonas sp. 24(2023)]
MPSDLQSLLGCKVIKRATATTCARVATACALVMQAAYAQIFAALRNDGMGPELDELLKMLKGKPIRELTLQGGTLPGGVELGRVEINDDRDRVLFQQTVRDLLTFDHWLPSSKAFCRPRRLALLKRWARSGHPCRWA